MLISRFIKNSPGIKHKSTFHGEAKHYAGRMCAYLHIGAQNIDMIIAVKPEWAVATGISAGAVPTGWLLRTQFEIQGAS